MKAVILAAGKGRRLSPLTDKKPKPLIEVLGIPILERLLQSLPPEIDDVYIVVDYLKEQIEQYFKEDYKGIKITYVEQGEMTGTYGALYSAKDSLQSGKFLVMGSDDLFNQKELSNLISHPLAFGVHKKFLPGKEWLIIEPFEGHVKSMRRPSDDEFKEQQFMATGVYVLDETFWKYEPYKLSNGEYGLPQSMRPMLLEKDFALVEMKEWLQINTHEELAYAESYIGKKHI